MEIPLGGAVLTKKHQQLRKTMLAQEVRKEHHAFSAEEVADFRRAFNSMDTDSSGGIDADEVKAVLQRFGQNPSDEELRQMVADVDEDGSGEIEFDEFIVLMTRKARKDKRKSDKLQHAAKMEALKAKRERLRRHTQSRRGTSLPERAELEQALARKESPVNAIRDTLKADGPKAPATLVYVGNKFFWRTSERLDIHIFQDDERFTVVPFHCGVGVEFQHMHLDKSRILALPELQPPAGVDGTSSSLDSVTAATSTGPVNIGPGKDKVEGRKVDGDEKSDGYEGQEADPVDVGLAQDVSDTATKWTRSNALAEWVLMRIELVQGWKADYDAAVKRHTSDVKSKIEDKEPVQAAVLEHDPTVSVVEARQWADDRRAKVERAAAAREKRKADRGKWAMQPSGRRSFSSRRPTAPPSTRSRSRPGNRARRNTTKPIRAAGDALKSATDVTCAASNTPKGTAEAAVPLEDKPHTSSTAAVPAPQTLLALRPRGAKLVSLAVDKGAVWEVEDAGVPNIPPIVRERTKTRDIEAFRRRTRRFKTMLEDAKRSSNTAQRATLLLKLSMDAFKSALNRSKQRGGLAGVRGRWKRAIAIQISRNAVARTKAMLARRENQLRDSLSK